MPTEVNPDLFHYALMEEILSGRATALSDSRCAWWCRMTAALCAERGRPADAMKFLAHAAKFEEKGLDTPNCDYHIWQRLRRAVAEILR